MDAVIFCKPLVCPNCRQSKNLRIIRVYTVTETYTKIPQGFARASKEENGAMGGIVQCERCKISIMSTRELEK